MKTIRNLDGVRGIAILLVLFFHLLLVPFGWMGVQLFFVLSGFLITRILVESKQRAFGDYLRRFYVRRLLRIFPLYFCYLAALGVLKATVDYPVAIERYWGWLATFAYNWTRADAGWVDGAGFTHMWSLCVEEQFYLVWPFVVFVLPSRLLPVFALALMALCPWLRDLTAARHAAAGLPAYTIADATYWNTLGQLDAFASGALVATLPAAAKRWLHPGWTLALGAAGFLGSGLLYQHFARDLPWDYAIAFAGFPFPLLQCDQHVWGYTVIDLFFAAIVHWSTERRDTWLLANPVLTEVGRLSYGMYVLHVATISLTLQLLGASIPLHSFAGVVIYLAVLYVLSKLVYLALERPFLRMKQRLAA